ncbi:MAG TPA: hypothetical protein VK932_23055 [Kofleriaceae bacterium]|nr:hypothetical protein [Kofleriaceae bacterium]
MLTTLACCGLLALVAPPGTAFAQDGETEEAAEGEPEAEGTPEDAGREPADDAPAAGGRWPRAVIARPLTLPKGLAQLGADLGANNDFSALGMNLVAGYGISDDLEATLFYGFALKDFEIKGNLDVDVGYKLLRGAAGGKLEVIGRARLGYSVVGEDLNPLRLGAHVQYNVTDKIALITPGQQLVIGLAESEGGGTPMFLQLPVAVGFQATPELYLQLDTTLAQIEISDSGNAFFGADTTPIAVTAVYNAMPALDVIASIGLDLTPPDTVAPAPEIGVGDTLTFLVGARYYLGDL